MKINTTNTTNKNNKKRVAITTIICAMVVFAMVVVGCGIKKNSTVAEAEADVIATVGTTIDTTETVEETTETETTVEETTEITETVEEPSEEPSVETPSENKPSETPSTTETPNTTPSENKPSETPSTPSTTETPSVPSHTHNYKSTVTNATCTSQGYTTYTCSCGDTYVSDYTNTTSHTYSNGKCTTCGTADPNVAKCMCGTPMQMMSGYIFHPAEGYYAPYVHFSNGEEIPYGDGTWINAYMTDNGITSYSLVENHWVETKPEWREENVTRMCCPSCRATSEGFIAY